VPEEGAAILIQRILDRLLGHDFFIAYGHGDGDVFPKRLHQALKSQRFSVFLDEVGGYRGGDRIDRGTQRFAGNARRLIIVAGPHALESEWVFSEIQVNQMRARTQVVIDDQARTFETAGDDHRLKQVLSARKWLKRATGDDNFNDIVVDLAAGFTQYRRETRFYLMLGGIALAILTAAFASVWLGYEGKLAREQAQTQQLLASTGRLTTQVEAALRANPPRREDALRIAQKATRDTLAAGLAVPSATEQALRDAIAGSGGHPVACGPANPPLLEAPRQLGLGGRLFAREKNGHLCVWNEFDLSYLGTLDGPVAIARSVDSLHGTIWEVDRIGHLFSLNASKWSDGFRLAGTLSGFVTPPSGDADSGDPETVITGSSVVQHELAGHAVRIWPIPARPVDTISAFVFPSESARFDVFYKQGKILLDSTDSRSQATSASTHPRDKVGPRSLCLLDLRSDRCTPVPGAFNSSPKYVTLDDSATHLAMVYADRLQLLTYENGWKLTQSLLAKALGSSIAFAAFSGLGPSLFVSSEQGEAVLWNAGRNAVTRLPTSYAPLDSAESVVVWTSRNKRWLIVNDMMRGVTGYRIDDPSKGGQRFYPLNLPLRAAVRDATLGGRLAVDQRGSRLAFGNSETDAILLEPTDDSLTVRMRHLAGHDAPVTDLAFMADGTRLLTCDGSGSARWWDTEAEQSSTLPIAIATNPEDRRESADDGNFVAEPEDAGTLIASDDHTVLLVGRHKAYAVDGSSDPAGSGVGPKRRPAKLGDFPRSVRVPTAIAKAAAQAAIGYVDPSDNGDAEILADGRVYIAFRNDDTARAYTAHDLNGRDLITDSGEKVVWRGHATDRVNDLLFVSTVNRSICRYHMTDASSTQKCFSPAARADSGDDLGTDIVVVSPSRLLVNNSMLVELSEPSSTYSISKLPKQRSFCGTTGHLRHYLYRLCDDETVLIRLDTQEPAFYRLSIEPPATAIWLEDQGEVTTAFAANAKGVLAAFRIAHPEPGAGRQDPWAGDVAQLAEGRLDSGARINAILQQSGSGEQPSGLPIYTADSNGDIWRWQWIVSAARRGVLEQSVRAQSHQGIAAGLAEFLRNAGKQKWIASIGTDDLVLISPEAVGPLLRETARVFNEAPAQSTPSEPSATPSQALPGSLR
jgi:TIR domain